MGRRCISPCVGANGVSRREFLEVAASVAGGVAIGPRAAASDEPALTIPAGTARSRVVWVESGHVVSGSIVHATLLREMLSAALSALTHTSSAAEAWRTVLRPDDVIGIKFNRVAQAAIGTTPYVADAIVTSLVDAGWHPDQIVCIEAPPAPRLAYMTRIPVAGWDRQATDFGSGSDQLSAVLSQVTALIDVPFVKTHNIAGITCALKNLSHGLVKHPARYHNGGCSPYIADIVATDAIRSKLRLCVVDALRVAFKDEPAVTEAAIYPEGTIMAAYDPVAVDSVALGLLNRIRRTAQLPPIARSPEQLAFLAAAHRRGLGIALSHGIEVVQMNMA